MTDTNDQLVALRDRLTDAAKGYEQAMASADDDALKALFGHALKSKNRSLTELEAVLPAGERGDGGTVVGTLTQGIVYVRSALTGDASLLPGMIDGERRVGEACAKARTAAADEPALVAILDRIGRREAEILADLEAAKANRE